MAGKPGGQGIDPLDAELGVRVRSVRQEKGISQARLAQALGVSFQQVQKYERGSNRISASTLVKIADTLGTTVSSLLGKNEASSGAIDLSFLSDRGAIELAQHFSAIQSPELRDRVLQLVVSLKRVS